ncbi:MAG: 50S ribosomal protein L17, partial [Planctomycetota bacterium]
LVRSLINEFDGKGYIVTTREKAKYAQPRVEKLITLGKNKSIANVRKAMEILQDRELTSKLFDEVGPYFSSRAGGYTRVLRLAKCRLGDNASQAYFGFVRDEATVEATADE